MSKYLVEASKKNRIIRAIRTTEVLSYEPRTALKNAFS